jgi:hypothetical protein
MHELVMGAANTQKFKAFAFEALDDSAAVGEHGKTHIGSIDDRLRPISKR